MHGRLGLSDMNDDFFDPLDDHIDGELRRRFEAASPHTSGDPDAVLDALRPQMQRARTRRRAAIGGAVAGVLAIVAVAGLALTGGPSSSNNVNTPPATQSAPRPEVTVTTTPVSPLPEPAPTELKQSGTNGGGAINGETGGSSGSSSSTGSSGEQGGSTPTTPPGAQTQTFDSAGGSITVTLANGTLTLGTVTHADGYTYQTPNSAGQTVEVRFFDAKGKEWRIRVDLVNGAMVPEITSHG